jgi:hypothetical protein
MNSESRFYALEVMCRARAAVARKEFEYWLAEAEEWAQLKLSCIARDRKAILLERAREGVAMTALGP